MSAVARYDAIITGSGPNGLAAAIVLARVGCAVLVFEAKPALGGGVRSADLTLPGFVHVVCSADWHRLDDDLLGPTRWPRHPISFARFGWLAMRSARGLAESRFTGERACALFAGLAAHSMLPLERLPTAAFGLVLGINAHAVGSPPRCRAPAPSPTPEWPASRPAPLRSHRARTSSPGKRTWYSPPQDLPLTFRFWPGPAPALERHTKNDRPLAAPDLATLASCHYSHLSAKIVRRRLIHMRRDPGRNHVRLH